MTYTLPKSLETKLVKKIPKEKREGFLIQAVEKALKEVDQDANLGGLLKKPLKPKKKSSKTLTVNELKLYTDGGARGNPGPAGCGFVVYDENDEILMQDKKFLGKTTNNQAEYSALIFALEEIISKYTPKKLMCYADSELLVKQLNREYKVKNTDIRILYDQIQDLIQEVPDISFQHIRREQNTLADRLANEAMDMRV